MKKSVLTLIALSCFLVAGMLFASPAAAFSGVQGRAFDGNGQPWTHGGQVYVFNNTTAELVASGDLNMVAPNAGRFDFPYSQTTYGGNGIAPAQGNLMSIYIVYNDGGVGTPGLSQRDYTELVFITGRYSAGNFDTGTGPTAVTLSGFDANAGFNANYAIAALFLALGGASVFVLRRRSVVQVTN